MRKPFEGSGQASAYAEIESRKRNCELWVVKSMDGGLHYEVIESLREKKETDKVLFHYKNGQLFDEKIHKTFTPPPVKAIVETPAPLKPEQPETATTEKAEPPVVVEETKTEEAKHVAEEEKKEATEIKSSGKKKTDKE